MTHPHVNIQLLSDTFILRAPRKQWLCLYFAHHCVPSSLHGASTEWELSQVCWMSDWTWFLWCWVLARKGTNGSPEHLTGLLPWLLEFKCIFPVVLDQVAITKSHRLGGVINNGEFEACDTWMITSATTKLRSNYRLDTQLSTWMAWQKKGHKYFWQSILFISSLYCFVAQTIQYSNKITINTRKQEKQI